MPYLSALEVCSRRGAIQIHLYLYLYLENCRRGTVVMHMYMFVIGRRTRNVYDDDDDDVSAVT